ncbi:MAG: aspartate kinase [Bacteroidota bacterium]
MKVFKFGGASVKDADAVKNVAKVLSSFPDKDILVVISAMGKTTNLLEKLHEAYVNKQSNKQTLFEELKQFHYNIINQLITQTQSHAFDDIENIFIELECLLEAEPDKSFDYHYDQIVSYGEIFSTKIVSTYLNEAGIKNRWMDAQNFISTDNTYREGKVNWQLTTEKIAKTLLPIVQKKMVITQGFIGRSSSNATLTLGREGSDYSAAIFAYGLNASSVTIWKDVAGVMNADPKRYPEAIKIKSLSYHKAIEMAFYGATVIHPKTIQPLLSKGIPLYVKSFINPNDEGTTVGVEKELEDQISTYIFKQNQMLISISSKDFSFIVEENLSNIFALFAANGVKINVMQNSAISFTVCVDYNEHKCAQLINELEMHYKVKTNADLELLTISNYETAQPHLFTQNKKILMEQRNRSSLQLVLA